MCEVEERGVSNFLRIELWWTPLEEREREREREGKESLNIRLGRSERWGYLYCFHFLVSIWERERERKSWVGEIFREELLSILSGNHSFLLLFFFFFKLFFNTIINFSAFVLVLVCERSIFVITFFRLAVKWICLDLGIHVLFLFLKSVEIFCLQSEKWMHALTKFKRFWIFKYIFRCCEVFFIDWIYVVSNFCTLYDYTFSVLHVIYVVLSFYFFIFIFYKALDPLAISKSHCF